MSDHRASVDEVTQSFVSARRSSGAPATNSSPHPRSPSSNRASTTGSTTVIGGRYRIECCIGQSRAGHIYRAWQLDRRRHVVLELMRFRSNAATIHRLLEAEIRATATLQHPGIVEIHDIGHDGPLVYIAMEMFHGTTLTDRLADGPLPVDTALELTRQLLDILRTAHGLRVVHRALGPSNIFVDARSTDWHVTVIDFGLVFTSEHLDPGNTTAQALVRDAVVDLSPEQTQALSVGPAADVYALGCVLYRMLTGQRVFCGSQGKVLAKHAFAPPMPPRKRRPELDIPRALDDMVVRMLAKNPADRPRARTLASRVQALIDTRRPRGARTT